MTFPEKKCFCVRKRFSTKKTEKNKSHSKENMIRSNPYNWSFCLSFSSKWPKTFSTRRTASGVKRGTFKCLVGFFQVFWGEISGDLTCFFSILGVASIGTTSKKIKYDLVCKEQLIGSVFLHKFQGRIVSGGKIKQYVSYFEYTSKTPFELDC